MRPPFQWRLRSRTLELGKRTLIMGVVNVTPDSFYEGGRKLSYTGSGCSTRARTYSILAANPRGRARAPATKVCLRRKN
jgi:dihydropteroate synthase